MGQGILNSVPFFIEKIKMGVYFLFEEYYGNNVAERLRAC
jgi:hypothetical protein